MATRKERELRALYRQKGGRVAEVAKALGKSRTHAYNVLRKAGIIGQPGTLRKPRSTKTCAYCGKEFPCYPVDRARRKTCSIECRGRAMRIDG